MKDEGLTTAPGLSLAHGAISYILRRIRVDADLRWHMIGTEAFHRLCAAEAERLGKPFEEIETLYSTPMRDDEAQLPFCRELLAKIAVIAEVHDLKEIAALARERP